MKISLIIQIKENVSHLNMNLLHMIFKSYKLNP